MSLLEKLHEFAKEAAYKKDKVKNENETTTSLVLPFFKFLGYEYTNPEEVSQQHPAPFAGNNNLKVDVAIIVKEKPAIVAEVKHHDEVLDKKKHISQLGKYFSGAGASFGILTNGIVYKFYTDVDAKNLIDPEPFFEFDVLDVETHESIVLLLELFAKKTCNLDKARAEAEKLKSISKVKKLFSELQTLKPTDEMSKLLLYIMGEVFKQRKTQKAIPKFVPIVKRGFQEYIEDCITEETESSKAKSNKNIKMAIEEIEGFAIVKLVLNEMVDVERLFCRHPQNRSYMAIHIDDHKLKRVCRFWFNGKQKYITIPDEQNKPLRYDVASVYEIYQYADELRKVCKRHL